MRKIIITLVAFVIGAVAVLLIKHNEIIKPSFTIECHKITLQTYPKIFSILTQLQFVWAEAFLLVEKPIFYAHDPRVANIPAEKKLFVDQKVTVGITEGLRIGFNEKINKLYADLQNKQISEAYVVISKDIQHKIIGFALMVKTPLKNHIDSRLISIVDGFRNAIDKSQPENDEVLVSFMAVVPRAQKKGIGKKLLFSIFDYCPHIKKIYLKTLASDLNKKAQDFYQHIGFTRVLKGTFILEEGEPDSCKEKIVYLYENDGKK